ncbi:MAG TPA: transketolase, partial [bacterium]|nr:transketolase [bacterium]
LLRTVKGKGVSFMEGRMDSHYKALTEAQYQQALVEVGG